MPRALSPIACSLAVVAAMFAFKASAEQPTAGGVETEVLPRSDPFPVFSPYPEKPAHVSDLEQMPEADVPAQPTPSADPVADGDAVAGKSTSPATTTLASEPAGVVPPLDPDDPLSALAMNPAIEGLEPYKLMRSLQFVQDAVVRGDHSAMEMQRFLLGVIDSRLRQAEQRVFDDPRNVDAALIYAMSGGNPETLEILALRDKFGNFDNEITTVLRAYLNGHASKTQTELAEVVELYRDTAIGPYLTLVSANVTAAQNDTDALELFDWARLTAPGTLVEEAALRRSLFIAARKNMVDEALKYAQLYARRFINSPYAGQYADLLVDLVVLNYGKVGDDRLQAILSFMDRPRKREVYLRIARKAVISGLRDLAVFASERAEQFLDESDRRPQLMADLYSGMARIPTQGVEQVLSGINGVSAQQLSRRDRALREAARIVATEVLRKPDPNSLTQAFSPMMNEPNAVSPRQQVATAGNAPSEVDRTGAPALAGKEPEIAADDVFDGYVSDRRKTLERIDKMLEGVAEDEGT